MFQRALIVVCGALAAVAALSARTSEPRKAADLVRDAVLARVGHVVDVEVTDVQTPAGAVLFRDVRLDPTARLGQPMRVVFTAPNGSPVPASAVAHVTADRVVTRRAIAAGATLSQNDVEVTRGELAGSPLRPVLTLTDAMGARTRRAIGAGTTLVVTDLILRRDVEPGDRVTAVATIGAVQVTGVFVAADGGRAGDIIRVVNPETHRALKARVTRQGAVEVINEP